MPEPGAPNLGEVDPQAMPDARPQDTCTNPDGAYRLFRVGDAWTSRNIHAAMLDSLRPCKDLQRNIDSARAMARPWKRRRFRTSEPCRTGEHANSAAGESSAYSSLAGWSFTHFIPCHMGATRFSRFHTR